MPFYEFTDYSINSIFPPVAQECDHLAAHSDPVYIKSPAISKFLQVTCSLLK